MNKPLASIVPLTLMMQGLHERYNSMDPPEEKPPQPPPWETAIMNIPKSIRKGKTWEEIREIKKQMWIKQMLEGELVCLKCGKTKGADQEDTADTPKFFLTPNGILCESCAEAEENEGA